MSAQLSLGGNCDQLRFVCGERVRRTSKSLIGAAALGRAALRGAACQPVTREGGKEAGVK